MGDDPEGALLGRKILVVEDEFLIAEELREALEASGAIVVGPVATVKAALAAIQAAEPPDGATLDMTLGRERSYDVAYALRERHVPFVILSGYGEQGMPEDLRSVPRCEKPFDIRRIIAALQS